MSEKSKKIVVTTLEGSADFSAVKPGDVVSVGPEGGRQILLEAGKVLTSDRQLLSDAPDGGHKMLNGGSAIKVGGEVLAVTSPSSSENPSYSKLPRHGHLTSDILALRGYWKDIRDNEGSAIFNREEAGQILQRLSEWLPQQVEPSAIRVRTEEKRGDERFIAHRIIQDWGKIPGHDEIRSKGPIIELAGPTLGGYSMRTNYDVDPDFTSNLVGEDEPASFGRVDFQADATKVPLADKSVGSVFISCLPGASREKHSETMNLRDDAIAEAGRVVKPGGYLFWRGGQPEDFEAILQQGFIPVSVEAVSGVIENIQQGEFASPDFTFHGVFERADVTKSQIDIQI